MRIALITGVYGNYDPIRPLPEWHGFDEAICVTDDLACVGEGWQGHLEQSNEPPRLASKKPKMMPWLYTDCDAAVWIDASFEITGKDLYKFARHHLDRDDFICWAHPEGRICLTQEAEVCQDWEKYEAQNIRGQVKSYLNRGMPKDWGLFAAGMLGYRFTPEVKRFGNLWYKENLTWSIQDQISLPYLLWTTGKPFGIWQANEYSNPLVRVRWDQRPNANV
jgi:hypothetical protein